MEQVPLSADAFTAGVTAATSAFGDATRRDIYLFAHAATDGVTTAEVARRFGLHPNVARHHLDKLAAGGYLEVHVERPDHAGAGRPSKHYRASARSAIDLPARRDDLIVTLLGRALGRLPEDEAKALAEEVGEQYGRGLAEAMSPSEGGRSRRAAMQAVADALTAHGFAAHAEARGNGSLAIINEHCPFGAAAHENPVICAIDRGMVRGMLAGLYGDTMPETESSRAFGDDSCVTVI
ncbi:MAG TPA: helix-turn-helix domain-containing protein [Acidimicrobiales bacterium]|nr:helix-turn-helix domain-containing protein [Acidimicrobiales bacterium]